MSDQEARPVSLFRSMMVSLGLNAPAFNIHEGDDEPSGAGPKLKYPRQCNNSEEQFQLMLTAIRHLTTGKRN